MQLEMWLTWIVGGGGAGAITYWLMEYLNPDVTPELKRYASLALGALFASLAFVVSVGFNYQPEPATTQAWIEQLFAVAFVAVTTGQVIHGRNRLREKVQIVE